MTTLRYDLPMWLDDRLAKERVVHAHGNCWRELMMFNTDDTLGTSTTLLDAANITHGAGWWRAEQSRAGQDNRSNSSCHNDFL